MILKDFNLTVAPGETVAIVGATGVGKSSIANLILRFYDVSAGSIVLDGRDIRDYTCVAAAGRGHRPAGSLSLCPLDSGQYRPWR